MMESQTLPTETTDVVPEKTIPEAKNQSSTSIGSISFTSSEETAHTADKPSKDTSCVENEKYRAVKSVIGFLTGTKDVWWWWEVGAVSISILSTIILLGVLGYLDSLTSSDWKMFIQPNSMISILTTAIKTTMMVPIGSCFGQMKWLHFTGHPDALSSLQLFDEASRDKDRFSA